MKYRKKPVVVDAVQFNGDNFAEIDEELDGPNFFPVDKEDRTDDPEVMAEVYDELHSTWVGVKQNQWIIRGVKGEFYPCDPEVFEATYEAVES